jgi:hypothetical protein
MNIGIVIIATNTYFILGLRLIQNLNKYYKGNTPLKFYFYSDTDPKDYTDASNINFIYETHNSWVDATNSKFKNILKCNEDYIVYMDADTDITKDFNDSLFLHNSVGVKHWHKELPLPYDRNKESVAYISHNTDKEQIYYQGAFFGGNKYFIEQFCKDCMRMQYIDRPYEPIWNDESYINKLFHENKPDKVIELKDFPFNVSDKAGLQEVVRNSKYNIDNQKLILLNNKNKEFNINNGNIILT